MRLRNLNTIGRAVCVVAALATLAGCKDKPAKTVGQAGGEVTETWAPEKLTAVNDVPVDAIRQGIKGYLDAAPPKPLTKETWEHASRLYAQYAGGPLWLKSKGLDKERAGYLMRSLSNIDDDALDLAAYPLGDIGRALEAIEGTQPPTAEQLARVDIMLTAAYAALGEDLLTGQVDPREMSQSWHIDPQEERVDSSLAKTLRSEPLDRAIATMRPQDEQYAALQKELTRHRDIVAKGGWPSVPEGKLVRPGQHESAQRIAAVRARLAAEGLLGDSASQGPATPPAAGQVDSSARSGVIYTKEIAGAVARFQTLHGIPVDSMLGPETVASLNVSAETRLAQIAANLERHRWLPRALGSRYLLVNVPAFKLEVHDGDQKKLEMKVIVGADYEGRATPVFADTMRYIIFRPYWNVTDKIAQNELWPKINADPGYMERNNYETFVEGGKTHIRQRPGEKNALGFVKFIFPNDFDIYLHDTPQDDLFEKDVRAFSHGCIRVEKPAELATYLLGWPDDKVQAAMHEGPNNRQINLKEPMPVYIAYFTTYVVDGQLHFGNDLYRRDQSLSEAVTRGALPPADAVRTARALREIADKWTKGR